MAGDEKPKENTMNRKMLKVVIMVSALFIALQARASFNISALDTGATTIGGTVDANWTVSLLSGGPGPGTLTGSAYLVPNGTTYSAAGYPTLPLVGPGPWVANDSTSSWISYYNPPTLPDETGETMQYQLRFIAASPGTATVSWLSDNSSSLYANGSLVGSKVMANSGDASTFESWNTPITFTIQQGINTIDLDVNNLPQGLANGGNDNPTGGRVEFIGGDVSVVPEPSTIISGVLMLLPFGASTLRILRRNRAA
jgi:hypothetical protein